MTTIRKFEEIEAWQKARDLTRAVYACTGSRQFDRDFALRNQMRRAAVSGMSNIAEGFERGGNAEFAQFLAIAKGSVGEVQSQSYVALDQGYISEEEFQTIQALASSTKKLIAGFMAYIKQSTFRGQKYVTEIRCPEVLYQEPGTRNKERVYV